MTPKKKEKKKKKKEKENRRDIFASLLLSFSALFVAKHTQVGDINM